MFVQVDVNHGDGLRVGRLQRLAETGAAYRCSRGGIVHVVFIHHVMDSPGEQEQRGGRQRRPALQKITGAALMPQPLPSVMLSCQTTKPPPEFSATSGKT